MIGICQYCGQAVEVGDCEAPDQEAYRYCDCRDARHRQRMEDQIAEAMEHLEDIFGQSAEEANHLVPIRHESLMNLLRMAVTEVGNGRAASVSVVIPNSGTAVIRMGSKMEIKISRRMSRTVTAEASI